MTEYEIRTWRKYNGDWEVTLNSSTRSKDNPLYFDDKYHKRFKTREKADEYAELLFKRRSRGSSIVRFVSPEGFGNETKDGFWTGFHDYDYKTRKEYHVKTLVKTYKDGVVTVLKDEQEHWA